MATAKSTQNNDWFSAQQQYWDTWLDAQRKSFQPPASGFQMQWTEFFKEWQNKVSGTPSANNTEIFQQYFAKAGEAYMNMLQQFYQGTGQAKPFEQMTQEWTDGLQQFFAHAFQTNGAAFNSKPFDMMGAADPLGFYASMPGLGYSREKQEQMNHLYQQYVEYERKSRDYNAGMAKVGLEAVQKFQEYLANPPKGTDPLKSLKEVYTKWVDVCEEIYAKYAMTEEYTKLYGDTVNALMNFKKQQNKMTDDMMEQFNLPTRQEVDNLHKQVRELKRELAALKPKASKKGKK